MKKSFKLIALILAITMLAVSLCSCRDLDEAKANRAVYTSADHTEIEYKGNIYRLVLNPPETSISSYYYFDWDKSAYVSDKDVPVMLEAWYGNRIGISEDEAIILAYYHSDIIDDDDYFNEIDIFIDELNRMYYVREDKYDDAMEVIKEAIGPL